MNRWLLFIVSTTLLVVGCQSGASKSSASKQGSVVTTAEMSKIGLAFQGYEALNNKGPAKVADLQPFLKDMEVEKSAYQKLAQGDIVFCWNATTKGMTAGASNTVLAFVKHVPDLGGLVLMGSGEVKLMTDTEFSGKPRADGK